MESLAVCIPVVAKTCHYYLLLAGSSSSSSTVLVLTTTSSVSSTFWEMEIRLAFPLWISDFRIFRVCGDWRVESGLPGTTQVLVLVLVLLLVLSLLWSHWSLISSEFLIT